MLTLSLRGTPEAVRIIRLPKEIECPPPSASQPETEAKAGPVQTPGIHPEAMRKLVETCRRLSQNAGGSPADPCKESPPASGKLLEEWAAACEAWLWVDCGNEGSIQPSHKRRCTMPRFVNRPPANPSGADGTAAALVQKHRWP